MLRSPGSPGQRFWPGRVGSRVSVSDPVFDLVLSFNMRVYHGVTCNHDLMYAGKLTGGRICLPREIFCIIFFSISFLNNFDGLLIKQHNMNNWWRPAIPNGRDSDEPLFRR